MDPDKRDILRFFGREPQFCFHQNRMKLTHARPVSRWISLHSAVILTWFTSKKGRSRDSCLFSQSVFKIPYTSIFTLLDIRIFLLQLFSFLTIWLKLFQSFSLACHLLPIFFARLRYNCRRFPRSPELFASFIFKHFFLAPSIYLECLVRDRPYNYTAPTRTDNSLFWLGDNWISTKFLFFFSSAAVMIVLDSASNCPGVMKSFLTLFG